MMMMMLYGWCRSSWTRRCCGILRPPWHFHGLILVDDARLDSWFILYCDRLIRNERIQDWFKPFTALSTLYLCISTLVSFNKNRCCSLQSCVVLHILSRVTILLMSAINCIEDTISLQKPGERKLGMKFAHNSYEPGPWIASVLIAPYSPPLDNMILDAIIQLATCNRYIYPSGGSSCRNTATHP